MLQDFLNNKKSQLNQSDSIKLRVLVKLKSKVSQISGVMLDNETLEVKISEPPLEGKANRALIELLSKEFGVAKSNVEIVSGASGRIKVVRINN